MIHLFDKDLKHFDYFNLLKSLLLISQLIQNAGHILSNLQAVWQDL